MTERYLFDFDVTGNVTYLVLYVVAKRNRFCYLLTMTRNGLFIDAPYSKFAFAHVVELC